MKVLMVTNDSNPYVSEIVEELKKTVLVTKSLAEFFSPTRSYDVIHIQWIEELSNWKLPESAFYDEMEKRLLFWKQKSRIVITRHNILPHTPNAHFFAPIYKLFFSYADAVVHLGKYSALEFTERYSNEFVQLKHEIINHHIYTSYPNIIDREDARKELGMPANSKTMLCFGKIRSKKEKQLILSVFDGLPIKQKNLLVPRWRFLSIRPGKVDKLLERIETLVSKKLHRRFVSNIQIPSSQVHWYFNAADVVFLPRVDNLNSGVLFLALAFKKIVVGPNVSNIKEVLQQVGFPIYDSHSIGSAIQSVSQALLIGNDVISQKIAGITKNYSLDLAVKKHLNLYRSFA